jgi:hypothetical protein
MGREVVLTVPASSWPAVAALLAEQLPPLLRALDPRAGEPLPHVSVSAVDGGVLVCDHLTDRGVAALVTWRVVELMLRAAPEVRVVEA